MRIVTLLLVKYEVAVFDGDKREKAEVNQQEYPMYKIYVLPKDDIRDKPPCSKQPDASKFPCYRGLKEGLTTEKGQLKEGTEDTVKEILKEINSKLQ